MHIIDRLGPHFGQIVVAVSIDNVDSGPNFIEIILFLLNLLSLDLFKTIVW